MLSCISFLIVQDVPKRKPSLWALASNNLVFNNSTFYSFMSELLNTKVFINSGVLSDDYKVVWLIVFSVGKCLMGNEFVGKREKTDWRSKKQ